MIEKNNDINNLKEISKKYKENYNPIINEFTKIYTYNINNEIVAFLIFTVMYNKCEIIDIYVEDNYRRCGIANKLINEVIDDYDLENITLEVSKDNINAISLYKKLGFQEVAVRKNYYNNVDGLLMLKEIR